MVKQHNHISLWIAFFMAIFLLTLIFSTTVSATLPEGSGCNSSSDCGDGLVCSGGVCSEEIISCESSGDCGDGQYCADGTCQELAPCGNGCTACAGNPCPDGYYTDGCECYADGINPCGDAGDPTNFGAGEECCQWQYVNGSACCMDCGDGCDTSSCTEDICEEEETNFQSNCNPDDVVGGTCGTLTCTAERQCPDQTACACGLSRADYPDCSCPVPENEPLPDPNCYTNDACGKAVKLDVPDRTEYSSFNCPCGFITTGTSTGDCGETITTKGCKDPVTTTSGCTSDADCNGPLGGCKSCSISTIGDYCNSVTTGTCVDTSTSTPCGPDPSSPNSPPCTSCSESWTYSGCDSSCSWDCSSTSETVYTGPSSCFPSCETLESTSSTSGCTTTVTRYCDDSGCPPPQPTDPCETTTLSDDPDDDNDGVSDCIDDCLNTPQTDTDGSGTADYLEVNSNGCSCSQLTGQIGTYTCPGDKCVDRDWYDYPGPFQDQCSEGVITPAEDIYSCTADVLPNDERCDPCMKKYGVREGGVVNTFTCPDSFCSSRPRYDGTDATIGNYHTFSNCKNVCRVNTLNEAYLDDVTIETVQNDYYDWDACQGCTVPRCEDGECGFRDVDNDQVCDDYDECLTVDVEGNVLKTPQSDTDANNIKDMNEVVLEGCSNLYVGWEECPTYTKDAPNVATGTDQNIIGCACSEIDLFQQGCPADRCKSNDYCASPVASGTYLDFPPEIRDRCIADRVGNQTFINITTAELTCMQEAREILEDPRCDPCATGSNLTKPDCDGDGVNTCVDKCPNTPLNETANNDPASVHYGCSCNQIEQRIGGFGTISCQDDKCVGADYYDYPDNIATTCSNGIVTQADPATCGALANVTTNAAACNVCTDGDPLNDPDLDNDGITECGDDVCPGTPQTDMNGDGVPEYQQVNTNTGVPDTLGCSCYELQGQITTYTCEDKCVGTDYYEYDSYSDSCFNGQIMKNPSTCSDHVENIIEDDPTCCALIDTDNDGVNDCQDQCLTTPQTDTDGNNVADYLEVNTDSTSADYGCACSELFYEDTICTGTDGCEYNKDPVTYPDAIKLWYDYPEQIDATCSNGVVSYSGTCTPSVNESIDCVIETTIDYDNFISFECETTIECPFGYRCEGDQCVIDGVDRDGDGYYTTPFLFVDGEFSEIKPVDCDDGNEFINPGETETYYNGYDDDCDLSTPDADQDGDGYRAQIVVDPYYVGGKGVYDCDDLDPGVTTECNNQNVCEVVLG